MALNNHKTKKQQNSMERTGENISMALQHRRIRKSKNRSLRWKITASAVVTILLFAISFYSFPAENEAAARQARQETSYSYTNSEDDIVLTSDNKTFETPHRTIMTLPPEPETTVTDEDFELLANVCRSEAGNQGIEGMRYIVACVLNRCENDSFPSTIREVIFQKGAFACTVDGNWHRYPANEDSREAVRQELMERSNYKILYFRTGHYHNFGTPLFKCKDHYFSGK